VNSKPFYISIKRNINELGSVIVEISGYLDAHTVVSFEEQMTQLIDAGAKRIIIDLEQLSYISSAGIGSLIGMVQRVRRTGGDVILLRPSQKVHKILDLLGFAEIFKIAGTEDEAIEALRPASDM